MKTEEQILSGFYKVIHLDNDEIEAFEIPEELIERTKNGLSKQEQVMEMIKLRAAKRRPAKRKPKQDSIVEFRRIPNTLLWQRIY